MSRTDVQKIEVADATFAVAQALVAGGTVAARAYAARWIGRNWDRVQPTFLATEARRASYERTIAKD